MSNRRVNIKTYMFTHFNYLLLTIMAILLSIAAYERNLLWQDDINLWDDVVIKSPEKARGYDSRGVAYYNKGQYDRAVSDFQKACDLGDKNGCKNLQKALGSVDSHLKNSPSP